jgi:hypothetical protein
MSVMGGWRSDDVDGGGTKHDKMVSHVCDNHFLYAEAAGAVWVWEPLDEDTPAQPGWYEYSHRKDKFHDSRARCEEVLLGYPTGYPDVLVYAPNSPNSAESAILVFEIKSHLEFDVGQTMRQLKTYLSRCPNAYGCLVLPGSVGARERDEHRIELYKKFNDEGLAVVTDGNVKYAVSKQWTTAYQIDEMFLNTNALVRWHIEHAFGERGFW